MGKKKGKDRKQKKRGSRGGSGRLSGMRSGMKSFVGTGKSKKKESTLSRIIWYLILAAAIGFVVYYRFIR